MSERKPDLPKVEPAKSSRSICRECRQKIAKDEIRVGNPYEFTTPKGDVLTGYSWFHLKCTPGYIIPEVINSLKANPLDDKDQQKEIMFILNEMFKERPRKRSQEQIRDNSPFLERSKSSRGKCRKCEEKIEKGTIRVAEPTMIELEDGRKFRSHKYYHHTCYIDSNEDPKSLLNIIIEKSLATNSIIEDDVKEIETEFVDLFQGDGNISEILDLIGSEPIKIQFLKERSIQIGISVDVLEKALERGMIQGQFFKPEPEMVQRLE